MEVKVLMQRIHARAKSVAATLVFAAIAVSGAGLAPPARAQSLIAGDVVKVDKSLGKIKLNHGEIKSIDVPPMETWFSVKDRAVLDQFNPGDKVRFAVEKIDGRYTLTTIAPAK